MNKNKVFQLYYLIKCNILIHTSFKNNSKIMQINSTNSIHILQDKQVTRLAEFLLILSLFYEVFLFSTEGKGWKNNIMQKLSL